MKKFIFILAFLILPLSAYADGAFLNVDVVVSNDNGGTLKPSDFQYEIRYDGVTTTLNGPVQAFGFPEHVAGSPLTYSVTPLIKSSYSSKTSESGCSGTIEGNKMPLLNCTIYQTDTGYPLPMIADSVAPVSQAPVIQESITLSNSTENEALIASLQLQIIDLLNQLIALLQEKARLGL